MKQLFSIYILLAIVIAGAIGLQFTDCGSRVGKFTHVSVSNCDTTKQACILKKNSTVTIEIDFSLSEDASEVTTIVHGKVLGVEMPFPLKNPNACVDSGLSCPLTKGNSYKYSAELQVLKSYPKVKVEVKWELKDQNSEDIVCILIPAKIE